MVFLALPGSNRSQMLIETSLETHFYYEVEYNLENRPLTLTQLHSSLRYLTHHSLKYLTFDTALKETISNVSKVL